MLMHVEVSFHLDVDSKRATLASVCTSNSVLFISAIALTLNGHWWTWAVCNRGGECNVAGSDLLLVLLRRVAIEFCFFGTVCLGTLFQQVVRCYGLGAGESPQKELVFG